MEGWYPGFDSSESGARKWGGKEERVNTKIMRGRSITLAGGIREASLRYGVSSRFIPSGLSQSGHFSRPCPPPLPVSSRQRRQTDVWLVIGVTVHTRREFPSPPPGGGGLEAAATSRGKNSMQPRLPENCTRRVTEFCPRLLANWFLCWLCSTRGTHEPFSPPPLHPPPTPLVFAPIPARGPSLSNEIRDEIFFFSLLFSSFSLSLFGFVLRFFLSFVKVRIYSYFCWNIFSKNGLVGNVIYCVCV